MTLNEYIEVYSKSTSQDAYGTISGTRTLIAGMYAKTRPLSGSERNKTDQREQYADFRFWIHHRTDLGEADVLVWNGDDYNIRFIANNGPKEPYMYIDAERGGAQ